jgi:hypothetical protein
MMNTLDLIGAMALTASAATLVITLVPLGFSGIAARIGATGALVGWFALVVGATALLIFDQHVGIGMPAFGIAVAGPVIAAILLAVYLPQLRAAVRAIPLPVLIAVNTVRVAGVLFVLLYFLGRLPAPSAPIAGFGDIAVGAAAPLVAWAVARRIAGWHGVLWLWNGLGILDLLTAVGLGVISADGSPIQLIFTTPNTSLMTTLPWILIPGFLVPLLMPIHVAVFDRLLRTGAGSGSLTRAAASWASRLAD